jgi:riboflavin kinase/FMN adenylyltransferase
MQIHRHIEELPAFQKSVLTIGTFDGVHLGHATIIRRLVDKAKSIGGTSIVITFYPHPRKVIDQVNPVAILTTQEEKYALMEALGVDHLIEIPFDKRFAEQAAESYIEDFLIHYFRPHTIIIGYDHRFGKNRTGNYQLLEQYSGKHGFELMEIPAEELSQVAISSTKIREALLSGDIVLANSYLGYAYHLSGKVTKGNQLGRTIGYPTANLVPVQEDKLIPANGVYIVIVKRGHEVHGGMMNIGVRPTVGGQKRTLEVNIFDFDKEIYDEIIHISFLDKIREEVKFDGLEGLKAQLAKDKAMSIEKLNSQYNFRY